MKWKIETVHATMLSVIGRQIYDFNFFTLNSFVHWNWKCIVMYRLANYGISDAFLKHEDFKSIFKWVIIGFLVDLYAFRKNNVFYQLQDLIKKQSRSISKVKVQSNQTKMITTNHLLCLLHYHFHHECWRHIVSFYE